MGAWADLAIDAELVLETDPEKFRAASAEASAALVEDYGRGAKGRAQTEVLARLGQFAGRYGGPAGLMDAIAERAGEGGALADTVQLLLCYAVLHARCSSGRNTARDRWTDDADRYLADLKGAAKALAAVAPNVLGLTRQSGHAIGGAVASIYT